MYILSGFYIIHVIIINLNKCVKNKNSRCPIFFPSMTGRNIVKILGGKEGMDLDPYARKMCKI